MILFISCNNDIARVKDKELLAFLNSMKDSNFRNSWLVINWDNPNNIALINTIKNEKTKLEGDKVAKKVNSFYSKTSGNPQDNGQVGEYFDSGVFIHGKSGSDSKTSMLLPTREDISTTYLRKDMTQGIPRPIFNFIFHQYDKGAPSPLVVYKNLSEVESKYMVFGMYPVDAATGARYKRVNNSSFFINQSPHLKDYKEEIDEALKNKKSFSLAKFYNMDNFDTYSKYISSVEDFGLVKSLSSSQKDFLLFKDLARYAVNNIKLFSNWNEVILRFFDYEKEYNKTVEAFFYMTSETNDYYKSPIGNIKKYNIHLNFAQKQQKIAINKYNVFIPILELDMDKMYNGDENPFKFNLEDQIVEAK